MTAFSDSFLPLCRQALGEESEIEVVSLGEVVRNFLVLCGEEVLPIAQSGHTQEAIAYACSQLDQGSPFFRSAQFPGFHEALRQTLDELHHWQVSAESLESMAEMASPRLAAKLRSLATLDKSVSEVLETLGRQSHTWHLRASLDATPELEGEFRRLLVVMGSEESPLRMQWLKWVADQGIDVTVIADRHAVNAPIFAGVRRSLGILGPGFIDSGDGNVLTRNLFATTPSGGPPIKVSVTSASDPLAEVEWALRGCSEYQDINRTGIYVRDLESYAPLIEAVAKRFGLSIQMARRAPLLTNSFARLTLAALKFCCSSDVRTLSPVVRSSYLGLSGNAQNGLNVQLRTCYKEKNLQWPTLEAWVAENADAHAWLTALLDWRRKFLVGGLRLPEWFRMLKEFNRDQLLPWVSLENKGGNMDERDRRAVNQMERLLANHISVDEVTQASTVTFVEFVRLCERLWSEGDVSLPTDGSGVRVTADPNVIGDVGQLHVLGMLEGVFPRRRSEDPVLTDQERHEMSELRPDAVPIPDSRTKAQAERDEFYRVCAAAGGEIVFSYPQTDDQKDNIPAFYLSEVERAVPAIVKRDYPRLDLAPAIEVCHLDADRRLREATAGPRETPLPIELITDSVIASVRADKERAFEPRVLQDALECPFKYLSRHVMRLRVNRQATRWGTLRKLPQVSQIIAKADLVEAEHALQVALNAELDQLYADVPEWEMQLLRSGGRRLIRDWINRETKSREHWPKTPGSTFANVSFGTHEIRNVTPSGVKLEGAIAGVSKLERYNVAHLYGSSVPDPRKFTDSDTLFYGLHMLALFQPGREVAIEIETLSGTRTLMVLGRWGAGPLSSSAADGLAVVDISQSDESATEKKTFYNAVNRVLSKAVGNILDAKVDAQSGEHCQWCDYGELCRRALGFGEDDSPFADAIEGDDGA